jgi:hypothetical protein
VVVDRVAHAPVWLQEMMPKDVVVFFTGVGHARDATDNLLVLEKLRTVDPKSLRS